MIFLGDYVDRGPDSAGVIDDLLDPGLLQGVDVVFLKGNHEATVLEFLEDAEVGPAWATFGGAETLASYGVRAPSGPQEHNAWEDCRLAFREAFPESHRRFMQELDLLVQRGDYLFVHAGVDPSRPLEAQNETEFLWIRDAFLESGKQMPWKVVHGHTPEEQPFHDRRRIGVDTGAYLTGRLTAARLSGKDVRFIST
jgi:serine/threonine protein phosphatase 1